MRDPLIRITREGIEVSGDCLVMAFALFVAGLLAALVSELAYGEVRTDVVVPALTGGLVGVVIGRWCSGRKDAPR